MRPESLPNRPNPAPETGQPKITSSAGRSPIPRASREVSSRRERQQESSRCLGVHAGAAGLYHTSLEPLHAATPHSNSAMTSATAARACPSHTRDLQCHQAGGGSGGRDNCHQAELLLPSAGTELQDAARHRTSLVFTFVSLGSFLHIKAQLTCRHLPWSAALLIQGERGD